MYHGNGTLTSNFTNASISTTTFKQCLCMLQSPTTDSFYEYNGWRLIMVGAVSLIFNQLPHASFHRTVCSSNMANTILLCFQLACCACDHTLCLTHGDKRQASVSTTQWAASKRQRHQIQCNILACGNSKPAAGQIAKFHYFHRNSCFHCGKDLGKSVLLQNTKFHQVSQIT